MTAKAPKENHLEISIQAFIDGKFYEGSTRLYAAPVSKSQKRSRDQAEALFPETLADLLTFEEEKGAIIIKPRQFLGSENFAKIASIVRDNGGDYISAGKESHFRIQKEG
jgi:hypothetical protein